MQGDRQAFSRNDFAWSDFRRECEELREHVRSRLRFVKFKTLLIPDPWEILLLTRIEQFQSKLLRMMDVPHKSLTGGMLDGEKTTEAASQPTQLEACVNRLMARLRADEEGGFREIAKFAVEHCDDPAWPSIASHFKQKGIHITFHDQASEHERMSVLTARSPFRDFRAVRTQIRYELRTPGSSRSETRVFWVISGPDEQTNLIKGLMQECEHLARAEKEAVADSRALLREFLRSASRAAIRNKDVRFIEQAITHLNKLATSTSGTLWKLLGIWYEILTTIMELRILPRVRLDPQHPFAITDQEIEEVKKSGVTIQPDTESLLPPGSITRIEGFFCSELQQKKLIWYRSAKGCSQEMIAVAKLIAEGFCLPERWKDAESLLYDSRTREARFQELRDEIRSEISKAHKDTSLGRKIDRLIREAYGLDERGAKKRAPVESAKQWVEQLQRLGLTLYPHIGEGNRLECPREILHPERASSGGGFPLSTARNIQFQFSQYAPKGSVVSCGFFSFNRLHSEFTVSLGPESEAPASLKDAYALLRFTEQLCPGSAVDHWKTLRTACLEMFWEEARAFLSGLQTCRLAVNQVRPVLESIFCVYDASVSEATEIFKRWRQYIRHHNWIIEPQVYDLGQKFGELSPIARGAIQKYVFDPNRESGCVVPEIASIDDLRRTIYLSLRASAGEAPRGYTEIVELLKNNLQDDDKWQPLRKALEEWPRALLEASLEGEDARLEALANKLADFYKRYAALFPEDVQTRDEIAVSINQWLDGLARVCEIEFWKPSTREEANDQLKVDATSVQGGANTFRVVRRGIKFRNKMLLAAQVRWVHQE